MSQREEHDISCIRGINQVVLVLQPDESTQYVLLSEERALREAAAKQAALEAAEQGLVRVHHLFRRAFLSCLSKLVRNRSWGAADRLYLGLSLLCILAVPHSSLELLEMQQCCQAHTYRRLSHLGSLSWQHIPGRMCMHS